MKIALCNLTTTTKSGGIETFNWEMARALAKRGHSVHIYGGKDSFLYDNPSGIPVYTFPYIRRERFPNFGTRFRRFMERLSFGFFANQDLIRGRYDYVYLIKPYDIPLALFVSSRSKARIIFGSSGTEFFPGYKQLVQKVHHFFACSEFNASQIERYCGIRPLVLPNGVDSRHFRPLSPDPELKRTLNLSDRDIVIMTVGRLVGLKGVKYAIGAVERIVKKGYPVKYFSIGEGEEREKLEMRVKSSHMEDHIFFLGNIPNAALPAYYSLASLAVFPTIAEESFGISLAEAMACGVPSISTAIGAIPEVMGDAGYLVPPGNEEALADALEKLITDGVLRDNLRIEGRSRIEERFSWDRITRDFEEHLSRGSALGE
jgi:glycosyltransferase involved in cell wall biosynthesis